jgi:PAS domain S-box-containing protein
MEKLLNRKIQLAFGSAILSLFILGVISYRGTIVAEESARWVRHTHEVLENLEDSLSAMQNVESSYRAFALTGKESYLVTYRASIARAERARAAIRNLTVDNSVQQLQIPLLESVANQKIQYGEAIIGVRRTQGLQAAADAIATGPGRSLMEAFEAVNRRMQDEELRLLLLREADAKRRLGRTRIYLTLGAALGLLITVLAAWSAQRDSSRRGLVEQALRESEERNRLVLDGIQNYAIFMIDPRGQILGWNAGAERIKGYKAEEIIGRNFSCFFPPEDIERGRPEEVLRLTAESGRHEEQGMRVRKDGSRFFASLTFTALRDPAGNLRGFSEFSHDLSESKESAKFRGLLEAAPDAMVVADAQGRIVLINAQTERLFGYRRDELVGQLIEILVPDAFRAEHLQHRQAYVAHAHVRVMDESLELRGLRKDATEFPAEISLSPLETADGVLVTAAIRDISVRKASEKHMAQLSRELIVKHQMLDSVVEGTTDPIYIRDLEDLFILANGAVADVLGRSLKEILGKNLREMLPKDSYDAVAQSDREIVRTGATCTVEEMVEIDGITRIFLTTKCPYRDADQKTLGTIGISREITERRNLEESRVEELKRDISARKEADEHLAFVEGGRRLMEEALRESEERYRMLLDGIQNYSIFMMDPRGQILSWHAGAERIKGYKAEEIIGHNFSCFFPPEDVERGRPEEVLRLTAEDGRHEEQGMRVRKDGSRFLASVTLTALRDPAGNLRGFSELSHDLSESKESGAKYRGLLEAAPDGMVVVNQGGEIVLLNLQAEKQFGYYRDELVGQKIKNIIPEGFAERLIADDLRTAADALAQQIGTGLELIGRRKDGTDFPIEIMLSPLESAEGILVTAAIRDISVRKDAENHLVQMEGRYRGLLEAAPDGMVVVNQGGEIVLLNLQAEKQFGYRRDELVGQKVKNIIPEGFAERLIADDLRSAADALAQQIGTGLELIGRRKDKSEFPIEIMLSPLESAEGILVTAAIRDISVRKDAESHLVQMEGRYRGLLEAAPDGMVVVNQSGEIVLLNLQAEKQFGYRRDELVGQKVKNIIPEGFAERLIADDLRSAADALAQQIGTGLELTGRRKDGTDFPIEIMLSPLESTEGILVTAAIRDISVRKKSEAHVQELNRSNEELGQFAYVASHDLQEPLRMVASYTQLLSRRYKGRLDADADEYIAFAVDGANRMQRLIQDLLVYSRVATKGNDLRHTFSGEALQRALINLSGAIEDSNALVTYDVMPTVLADEMQLVQLFQNLVGNAIKYQNPGIPLIHISAARNGGKKWIFSVKDNGLGIEPQYFDKIFGMFQRLHKREEFTGTGIGLAICKKIVERHGGSISVESQLGHGSTFRFALAGSEGKS